MTKQRYFSEAILRTLDDSFYTRDIVRLHRFVDSWVKSFNWGRIRRGDIFDATTLSRGRPLKTRYFQSPFSDWLPSLFPIFLFLSD